VNNAQPVSFANAESTVEREYKDILPNQKQEFQLSNLVARMYHTNNCIPIQGVFLHFRRKSFKLKILVAEIMFNRNCHVKSALHTAPSGVF
jgi:hypothetical protein